MLPSKSEGSPCACLETGIAPLLYIVLLAILLLIKSGWRKSTNHEQESRSHARKLEKWQKAMIWKPRPIFFFSFFFP
jgi:hypothetical protein